MKNFKILFSSILTLTFLLQPIQVFAQNTNETQNLINSELSFEKTQDLNTLTVAASNAITIEKAIDPINIAIKIAKLPGTVITSITNDAKACYNYGGVQECLSTCGVSMDAATLTTAPLATTGGGVLVPVGTAVVGALCDTTNGLIYLVKGEYVTAGITILAVIPAVGLIGKPIGTSVKVGADEIAKVAAAKAEREAARTLTSFTRSSIKLGDEFGGHAFARHINIDDAGLLERFASDTTLKYSSKFTSPELADTLIRDTVMSSHDEVVKWMGDVALTRNKQIEITFSQSIGYGYKKVGDQIIKVENTNKLTIYLKKSTDRKDFFIETAFPDITK